MRPFATSLAVLMLAAPASQAAGPAAPPVVVELFTSEGCSSCPPADAFLTELARTRADVLPLAFHVTYWDYLGWRDPYALPAATERQRAYARAFGSVYTPELVVDGRIDVVGSDRAGAFEEIARAAQRTRERSREQAQVRVSRDGAALAISVGAGAGTGTVLLVGYDVTHTTQVGRGENGGRTLTESNVVRDIQPLGPWTGQPAAWLHAAPAGERSVVLVQAPDGGFVSVGALAPGS